MKSVFLAAILFVAPVLASPPEGKVLETWASPSGAIVAAAFSTSDDGPRQVFLRNAAGDPHWSYLCNYERSAKILFSPDEKWIALNDYMLSNVAEIRLFQRKSGLQYVAADHKPSEVAWALLSRLYKAPYPAQLDHYYSEVVRWGSDSSAILICLWGHADTSHNVNDWLCVYLLNSRSATVDLSGLNHGTVIYKHEKHGAP